MDGPVITKHDIGLVTASRLVAIFWAGIIPLAIPAWIIIRADTAAQIVAQDKVTASIYVSHQEFEDRMKLLDERAQRNTETLNEIRADQKIQREMLAANLKR
jgi:hypothetical protein